MRLTSAWVTRADIVSKTAERDKLQQASSALSSSTEETRRNLRAIEKNKTAEPAPGSPRAWPTHAASSA